MIEEQPALFSILCDSQTNILVFTRDDLGISQQVASGQPFTQLIDPENREKALNFLIELQTKGAAFGWPLTVYVNGQVLLLYFAGGMNGDGFFIIGTKAHANINQLYDEMMKINNEQVNQLRKTIKQQMVTVPAPKEEPQLYEELTRVNNDLANTQRELAKKNVQLQQQQKKLETLNQTLRSTIEELQKTRDELIQSEKMASLGRLVSGFAHEINTPIGVALTAASAIDETTHTVNFMLNQEDVSETELVAALEKLSLASQLTMSNLRRAAELVSSFKRTSIDQTVETKRLFGLHEIIHDIIVSLNSKFKKTAITIESHCPTTLNLYSYPGIMSQILTNLMLNSLIHGFDEGQLAGKIIINAYGEDNRVHLDYSDTGKGMEQEVLEKLFEPFYTTKRARGGTGLGMYICYNLVVTRLKGTISCQSQVGTGSQFYINFPLETVSTI